MQSLDCMNLSHGLQTDSFIMYIKSLLNICRGPTGFAVEPTNTVTGVEHRDLFLNLQCFQNIQNFQDSFFEASQKTIPPFSELTFVQFWFTSHFHVYSELKICPKMSYKVGYIVDSQRFAFCIHTLYNASLGSVHL